MPSSGSSSPWSSRAPSETGEQERAQPRVRDPQPIEAAQPRAALPRFPADWYESIDLRVTAERMSAPLAQRLLELAHDRASSGGALVLDTSQTIHDWLLEQPDELGWNALGVELEQALREWIGEQAWRGTCALWLDSLRRAWHWGRAAQLESPPRNVLAEELGLWLWARDEDLAGHPELDAVWDGVPLSAGRRLPRRRVLAGHAARTLEQGETVLATAFSESVMLALEAAQRSGRKPTLLMAEALPNLDARRMARRLAQAGIPVHLCYDSGLLSAVPRADRIWLSTEGIGVEAFLARIGTRTLLEEADRREIPVAVLATSDKLVPGGELALPAWASRDTWLLWDDAPEGVQLESQCFEAVPLDLAPHFITEVGAESAAALHLRGLRLDVAAPCDAPAR